MSTMSQSNSSSLNASTAAVRRGLSRINSSDDPVGLEDTVLPIGCELIVRVLPADHPKVAATQLPKYIQDMPKPPPSRPCAGETSTGGLRRGCEVALDYAYVIAVSIPDRDLYPRPGILILHPSPVVNSSCFFFPVAVSLTEPLKINVL